MDTAELQQLYAGWPTEKLVTAAVIRPDEYNPAAIAVMRRVLDQRGVSRTEIDSIAATLRLEDRNHSEVASIRGWLLVFVLWSAASSAVAIVIGLLLLVVSDHALRAVGAVLVVGMGIYGGYCTSLLARRDHEALSHARRWLIGLAVIAVLRSAIEYVIAGHAPSGSGTPIVFAGIWLTYLARLERVRRVYRT
jgi:hypothetical protein